jgi:hypothetical protein
LNRDDTDSIGDTVIKKTLAAAAVAASAVIFAIAGTTPAMAETGDELVVNGHFDQTQFWKDNGQWFAGEKLGAWDVGGFNNTGSTDRPTVVVWNPAMQGPGATMAAPFEHGSWIRVMGSISQSIPTTVGATYTLTYLSRASGSDANDIAMGWGGGNLSRVLIDGTVVDSLRTATDPLYTTRTVNFTATSTSTLLTLANNNGGAVGFDEVSVVEVPAPDSPVMLPALAGGVGMAALAAGGVAFTKRKNTRAGK